MKLPGRMITIAGLLVVCLFSCKEPDEDPVDGNDIFSAYDRISPDKSYWQVSLADFLSFEHFYIDDMIHLVTTGERTNIRAIELDSNGVLRKNIPVFDSEYQLDISSASLMDFGGLLVYGEIFNEEPGPHSDPFYKSVSKDPDMRIFEWQGRNNSIVGVTQRTGDYLGALCLTRDETGSIWGGKYPVYQYYMIFTEHYDDSAYVSPTNFDSCYIDYYDKPDTFTERFVGVKIDEVTADTGIVTHMFYSETAGGNYFEYNLGDLCPGKLVPENIYYENVNPLKIYKWTYANLGSVLILDKYAHNGTKEYSRNISLFEPEPGMEAVCHVEKSSDHQHCLIYGYFQQRKSPDPPVYKGSFLIRTDDEGNETHRVLWDQDINNGNVAGEFHIQDIGNDQYVFLYSFDYEEGMDYFAFQRITLK